MMNRRHHGFTLMELMVAIGVMALVIALLAFPLMSAFGYIQKTIARGEAQRSGEQAARKLARDIETAAYIYDLPADGSWVSLVYESEAATEKSLGMPMDFGGNNVRLVRYAQVLDFPWVWNIDAANPDTWVCLKPNYAVRTEGVPEAATFSAYYVPYHTSGGGLDPNPYILARHEETLTWNQAWGVAAKPVDGTFPMDDSRYAWVNDTARFPTARERLALREQLWRLFRNDMIAVTPYGGEWDVPRFQVTPLRLNTEALMPAKDEDGRQTSFLSRYPLWCGRNVDVDNLEAAQRDTYLGAGIEAPVKAQFPLYPLGVNPYGYQIRVFNKDGQLVYGGQDYDPEQGGYASFTCERHFMDWPAVERPDWTASGKALWGQDDITRQRLEGKLVFAQPMAASTLTLKAATTYAAAELPIPIDYAPPIDTGLPQAEQDREQARRTGITANTYLVDVPRVMTLQSQADPTKHETFKRVYKIEDLVQNTFCVKDFGVYDSRSRRVYFGPGKDGLVLADGDWDVIDPATLVKTDLTYTICDLQPTDTVVATYSTRAVVDIALSVSRKDRAARTQAGARQDYTIHTRAEARNAMKRARSTE